MTDVPKNPPSAQFTLGAWLHIPSGFAAELLATAGFDWCCIDRQHGLIGESDMFDMIRAIAGRGIEPAVRVSGAAPAEIGRALDAGASTVIVPNISSLAEAEAAAAACHFQPEGRRSYATTRSKAVPPGRSPRCFLMIETAPALALVDEIAAIRGVAGMFIGPADLLRALDDDPQALAAAVDRVAATCRSQGLEAGAFLGDGDVTTWGDLGFSFLALASDSVLLHSAATELVKRCRTRVGER